MKRYLAIYSRKDEASYYLATVLQQIVSQSSLPYKLDFLEIPVEPIYADYVDREYGVEADLIIFLSRHVAKSNIPAITCHPPGNPNDKNLFGGQPRSLPYTQPCFIGEFLRLAAQNVADANLDYEVTLEVTHHGPTELNSPVVFVEIGPTPKQWHDVDGAVVVGKSVVAALSSLEKSEGCLSAVGLGGPHYAPIFTSMTLEENYNFGHIISKHILQECDIDIIEEAIRKSGDVDIAVVNWKGLKGGVRQCVYNYLMSKGLRVIKR